MVLVAQEQESEHFANFLDTQWWFERSGQNCATSLLLRYTHDQKKRQIWTAIIATKQWFTKLFTSEADALVDDFGNNPPPKIGTQSYTGDTHDKGDWFTKN